MIEGQRVKKWTWLMDDVEAIGRVVLDQGPTGDSFGLIVTENYKHLTSYASGSNGSIKCETYVHDVTDNQTFINRTEPFPGRPKGDNEAFQAYDPRIDNKAYLRGGEIVRVTGRWVIENAHWIPHVDWPP